MEFIEPAFWSYLAQPEKELIYRKARLLRFSYPPQMGTDTLRFVELDKQTASEKVGTFRIRYIKQKISKRDKIWKSAQKELPPGKYQVIYQQTVDVLDVWTRETRQLTLCSEPLEFDIVE